MHLRQRQKSSNEGESPHLAAPQLEAFSMAGKPLTTSFDAGVPLRDVQEAASHAGPCTTMRYDRARGSLDRHATYIVATYLAGATR
jgi:integrase/recombinase XerD